MHIKDFVDSVDPDKKPCNRLQPSVLSAIESLSVLGFFQIYQRMADFVGLREGCLWTVLTYGTELVLFLAVMENYVLPMAETAYTRHQK